MEPQIKSVIDRLLEIWRAYDGDKKADPYLDGYSDGMFFLAEELLDKLEIPKYEREPEPAPETVTHRAFWGSGRSDISERMEDIIHGPAPDDITADN